ncbi:MAG TPA: hypothetical protein P5136_00015 [Methanofastidiosum sp.]|nr:hypothetical protein [Methanofastidiosum sp.]
MKKTAGPTGWGGLTESIRKNLSPDVESNPYTPNIFTLRPTQVPSEPLRKEPVLPVQPQVAPPTKTTIIPEPTEKPKEEDYKEFYTLRSFMPKYIDQNQFFTEEAEGKPGDVDSSYTVLEYLHALGYRQARWMTGPEYKDSNCHKVQGRPICEARLGLVYGIKGIMTFSENHRFANNYNKPKPFIAMAHPRCRCHLICLKPDRIPENAPGLTLFARKEIKEKFKANLLSKLENVYVDRWTTISQTDLNKDLLNYLEDEPTLYDIEQRKPGEELEREYSYDPDRIVLAEENWEEDIRPISLTQDFLYWQFPGFFRAVPKSYIGFQLEKTENKSRVFLSNLGYEIIIPKNIINYIEVRPAQIEPDANVFIDIDGELGILLKYEDYEEPLCYLPSFREFMYLDGDFKTLETIGV